MRLAVQFQSVLDAFTPHDTVFAFTSAEELSESALGLNTILKSGSKTSSSSSLRQQRLKEIVEDNEETSNVEAMSQQPVTISQTPASPVQQEEESNLPASAVRARILLAQRKSENLQSATTLALVDQERGTESAVEQQREAPPNEFAEPIPIVSQFPPRTSSFSTDKALPLAPAEEAASPVSLNRIVSTYGRPSFDYTTPAVESDSDDDFRRPVPKEYHQVQLSNHLTATESSNISRWTDEVVASTRSKQKRAPKPHSDNQARPKTSGTLDDNLATRRVANLPSSVRVSTRIPSQSSRPGSQQSARSVPGRFVPSPNLPPPLPSPTVPESPEQQRAETPQSHASSFAESQAVAPEKMRLMKALQMRKRNQLLAQRSASAGSNPAVTLNSIDSSSSRSSLPTIPQDTESRPTEVLPLDNAQVSTTTSPTSIMTASDTQSTKPSSISEQSPANRSQTSLSSDTNSSTTPKADDEQIPSQMSRPVTSSQREKDIGDEHNIGQGFIASLDKPLPHPLVEKSNTTVSATPINDIPTILKVSKRRQPFEGKIEIPASTTEPSEISDDESFMEELQNATVQEAKPMSVNRTPMTPVLAKIPTRDVREWTPNNLNGPKSRTPSHSSQVSTPDRRTTASRAGSTRSLSSALPQWPPVSAEPVPVLPKQRPQISAGIVTRVKTFESLGQKDINTTPTQKDPSSRMSSFSNILKRASVLSHSYSGDKLDKSSHVSLPSSAVPDSDDEAEKTGSRPIVQRPGTSAEVYSPTHKGESITITARIIRDPTKPQTAHGTGDAREMHWSPLIVEHQNSEDNDRPTLPRELTTKSADSLPTNLHERRRFSFSSHKGTKPMSPTDGKSHRFSSGGSHKKPSRTASEASSITDEKKSSRTSRMLKRLSGLGLSRSRNKDAITTPPTQESPHPETISEQGESVDPLAMRTVVDIGEVNVQFPETLLWKRRFLRVDDQGFLIFAAPVSDSSSRGKSRKIHLEELLQPALPDREREQMSWSIVLDLKTGGTVQCACENGSAQRSFLKSKSHC